MASQCGGRLSPDRFCKSRLRGLKAASILAGRFNLAGGFLRRESLLRGGRRGLHRWTIVDSMMNIPLLYWAFSGDKGSPVCPHCQNPCGYGAADAGAGGRILRAYRMHGSADRRVSGNPGRTGIRGGDFLVQGTGLDPLWVCPELPLYGKYGVSGGGKTHGPLFHGPMRLSPITFRSAISASLRFRTRGMPPQACARPAGF